MKTPHQRRFLLLALLSIWPLSALISTFYVESRHYIDVKRLRVFPSRLEPDERRNAISVAGYGKNLATVREMIGMLNAYNKASPSWKEQVRSSLSEDVQHRLESPQRSRQNQELAVQLFRPLVTCPSRRRIGNRMNGFWMCGATTFFKGKDNCIVYAFNWNITDQHFEKSMLRQTRCTIHVFDPFLNKKEKAKRSQFHKRLIFHDYTFGRISSKRFLLDELLPELISVNEYPLQRIMAMLNHRWVDVIKLDYHHEEVDKLTEMILDWKSTHPHSSSQMSFPVGQLLFQLYTNGYPSPMIKAMLALANLGLVSYSTELNTASKDPLDEIAFGLINLRDRHTFEDRREEN